MKNTGTVVFTSPEFNIMIQEYQLIILKKYGIKKRKAEIIQKFAQEALNATLNKLRDENN